MRNLGLLLALFLAVPAIAQQNGVTIGSAGFNGNIGVAIGTSLALGGVPLGSNVLAVGGQFEVSDASANNWFTVMAPAGTFSAGIQLRPSGTGGQAVLTFPTNSGISAGGSGYLLLGNSGGAFNHSIGVQNVSTAVNHIDITGGATTAPVTLNCTGTDTNVGCTLSAKGAGIITVGTGTNLVAMPSLAASSAAQTGTVCWTTATGNLTVDTTTTCLLSSLRFKQDIKSFEPSPKFATALDELMALRPVTFRYKPEVAHGDPGLSAIQPGFIAEELNAVDPRLVAFDADGSTPRSARYEEMVAVLTAAIQSQQAEIENLKRQAGLPHHGWHWPWQ